MARARSGSNDLVKTLATSPVPVYLLNSQRAIVYANQACADWLGVEVEHLLGARCDYHSVQLASSMQTVAAGLCPPPEAFHAPSWSGIVSATRAGTLESRRAEFHALPVIEETTAALLVIVASSAAPAVAASKYDEPSSAELHVLLRWVRQTMAARPALDRWVGDSPAVRRLRDQFRTAGSHARVVFLGRKGSGRRDLARGLHYFQSTESESPLQAVDSTLVDAESLQMAIISLTRQRNVNGTYQTATLLLEEVDQLAPDAQRELLGFLQLPGFEIRTLCTAQRSLLALAKDGQFDRDLAFLLSTLVIEVPPLSERMSDLPLLLQALVEELNSAGGKQVSGVSPEAAERFAVYRWPGDLQQLAGAVQEAWTMAATPLIGVGDLPRWLIAAEHAAAHPAKSPTKIVLDDLLTEVERELIARALRQVRGNKARAARLLSISRPRLLRRMEQLGLITAADVQPTQDSSDS